MTALALILGAALGAVWLWASGTTRARAATAQAQATARATQTRLEIERDVEKAPDLVFRANRSGLVRDDSK